MRKNNKSIPVNGLQKGDSGIVVKKLEYQSGLPLKEAAESHRHDYHIFIMVEEGEIHLEVDFEKQLLKAGSVTYIHPSQIHRIVNQNKTSFYLLGITSENIEEEYVRLLEQTLFPVKPIDLNQEVKSLIFDSVRLCEKIYQRKAEKLYFPLVKNQSNAFIGICVSQYLQYKKIPDNLNRYEMLTKAFRESLEQNFTRLKSASEYAKALNVSASYLRECIRKTTGISVSEHIQNRNILEVKRLLYHTDKSVKEIALYLGYEDYSYFSRFFKRNAGITALEFRNQVRNNK